MTPRWTAHVVAAAGANGLNATVWLEPGEDAAFAELARAYARSYAWLLRVRGEGWEAWGGGDAALRDHSFEDDLPRIDDVSVGSGPVTIEVEFIFFDLDDHPERTLQLGGDVARVCVGETRVALVPVSLTGEPFVPPRQRETPAATHSLLVARSLAVLPEVGLLAETDGGAELVTTDGREELPALDWLAGVVEYARAFTAGPDGCLAVSAELDRGQELVVFRRLDEAPRRLQRRGELTYPAVEGRFSGDGQALLLAADISRLGALFEGEREPRWSRRVHAPLAALALEATADVVSIAGAGRLQELDLLTGAPRRHRELPREPAGACVAFHPGDDRFAWARPLALLRGPLAEVAWFDLRTGRQGRALLADRLEDARLVLLTDGSLLVAGDSLWRLDPGCVPARLGPRPALPFRPLVTYRERAPCLWTLEPRAWLIEPNVSA